MWSRRVGETEYGVKAIPLGGYVRMIGMFPPQADGAARPDANGRWATLAEQARQDAAARDPAARTPTGCSTSGRSRSGSSSCSAAR